MVNALLISIHARFAREMALLPAGVEVILCMGSEDATRDFDDFSTTESLIASGREEASEVVRLHGLGRRHLERHHLGGDGLAGSGPGAVTTPSGTSTASEDSDGAPGEPDGSPPVGGLPPTAAGEITHS